MQRRQPPKTQWRPIHPLLEVAGVVGVEQDGSPRIEKQTYGNATKVVHDRNRRLMAMLAGPVNIGQISALDVMVLQMAPEAGIMAYPGKTLHHPRQRV